MLQLQVYICIICILFSVLWLLSDSLVTSVILSCLYSTYVHISCSFFSLFCYFVSLSCYFCESLLLFCQPAHLTFIRLVFLLLSAGHIFFCTCKYVKFCYSVLLHYCFYCHYVLLPLYCNSLLWLLLVFLVSFVIISVTVCLVTFSSLFCYLCRSVTCYYSILCSYFFQSILLLLSAFCVTFVSFIFIHIYQFVLLICISQSCYFCQSHLLLLSVYLVTSVSLSCYFCQYFLLLVLMSVSLVIIVGHS